MTTVWCLPTPIACREETHVSDNHEEDAHVVAPSRTPKDSENIPNPMPRILKESIAKSGRLLTVRLIEVLSKDIARERLDACRDDVTVKTSPARCPCAQSADIDVSEAQLPASCAVPQSREQ